MKGKTPPDPESLKPVLEQIDRIDVDPLTKVVASTTALLGGDPVPILVTGMAMKLTSEAEAMNPKPEVPSDYDETERVIAEMLWENTGCHPLDSGFFGRHWERNRQIKDFKKTPVVIVDEDVVLINVFHYLAAFLLRDEMSKRLEEQFYKFAERTENADRPWIDLMTDFARRLKSEGWRYICVDNSANHVTLLSQDIQYVLIEHGDYGQYIILQIHNGADIRGGYTKPRFFKLREDHEDDFFFYMDEIYASCGCTWAHLDGELWESYRTADDKRVGGFPGYWRWSRRREAWVCRRCKSTVEFHHVIEDGF